ncbi:2-dehydro-3-deoxygalactonokinase [Aestuariibacter sp. A3R04]|uniref:2-dehydro-3-deoxygalactonokinase n=1 Tax=Aestuariibacter sp. A3R04 TaxID=2841571 RepID=UPI001C08FBF6|nr:2-dehydro-3-deoxygalactonokinase [Aestuariibacter sp. A3R04]MBU3021341.1 2-dehydro-3-deoxygalactonokinase [Aestuariibacter sp. A3R04]
MQAEFVGLDWGTSKLQAYAFDKSGYLLAVERFPVGVGHATKEDYINAIHELAERWQSEHWYASGMIGSDLGWQRVDYLTCPTRINELAESLTLTKIADKSIYLVPGLKCQSVFDQPDVMRGEELEAFGSLIRNATQQQDCVLCIPGTHTKWVTCSGSYISQFSTALSSELYDCLSRKSVLQALLLEKITPDDSFLRGVEQGAANGRGLTRLLFGVRVQYLLRSHTKEQCSAYCRGLLIGHEISDSMAQFPDVEVVVIGNQALCELYITALKHLGYQARDISSKDALTTGFLALHLCREEIHA